MNWNYTKFIWKLHSTSFFLWPLVTIGIFLLPFEMDEETRAMLMLLPCIFNLIKANSCDLIPKNTSNGKSASMKYLLSLNMTKKELYCNYILSSLILYFPPIFAFSLITASLVEDFNPWLAGILASYVSCVFFFFVSNANFYQKFFVHKAGTFQDQFLKGHNFYFIRLTVFALVGLTLTMMGIDYYAPQIYKSIFSLVGMILVFLTYMVINFHLYIPVIFLLALYKYRKSLKDFADDHYFLAPFRNEAKEKKMIFASIGVVISCLCFIDYPTENFRGNKLTEAIYYQNSEEIQKYATAEYLNAPSLTGLTPIMAAALDGQWETYQFLKAKGADLSAKNETYDLFRASLLGKNLQIIEDVINLNLFDINKKNESGFTPLHYASRLCKGELAKLLVNKGADINAQDNKGLTPLHLAVQHSCNDLGLTLLSLGADPLIKDKDHRVAIDLKKKDLLPFFEEQLRKPASIEVEE